MIINEHAQSQGSHMTGWEEGSKFQIKGGIYLAEVEGKRQGEDS